jgi:hypothetical protein
MTVTSTLGLEWGLGKQMLMLAELSNHDSETSKGIIEGIDCENDAKLLLDPLIGYAFTKIRVVMPPGVVGH